jgi:hypothetical protein
MTSPSQVRRFGSYNRAEENAVLLAGSTNTAEGGPYAVVFGTGNEATAYGASVTGDYDSVATGIESTVSGGWKTRATGYQSWAAGGEESIASGERSSVSDGASGTASGRASSVSGGRRNRAVGALLAGVSSVREKIGEPWGTFKTPSPPGMIREMYICEVDATHEVVAAPIFEGELKPEIGVAKSGSLNGTKALAPSTVKFSGASTGELHSERAVGGTDEGSLKYLGYNEQEVITVKP